MRCTSCDKNLNDYESTRKNQRGEYPDLCNRCWPDVYPENDTNAREDLDPNEEVEIDEDYNWDDFEEEDE